MIYTVFMHLISSAEPQVIPHCHVVRTSSEASVTEHAHQSVTSVTICCILYARPPMGYGRLILNQCTSCEELQYKHKYSSFGSSAMLI